MKKFIQKDNGSNYYLESGSMGCAGEPIGHPNCKYYIAEYRGGHEKGSMSVSYAALECDYLPEKVKKTAESLINGFNNKKEEIK